MSTDERRSRRRDRDDRERRDRDRDRDRDGDRDKRRDRDKGRDRDRERDRDRDKDRERGRDREGGDRDRSERRRRNGDRGDRDEDRRSRHRDDDGSGAAAAASDVVDEGDDVRVPRNDHAADAGAAPSRSTDTRASRSASLFALSEARKHRMKRITDGAVLLDDLRVDAEDLEDPVVMADDLHKFVEAGLTDEHRQREAGRAIVADAAGEDNAEQGAAPTGVVYVESLTTGLFRRTTGTAIDIQRSTAGGPEGTGVGGAGRSGKRGGGPVQPLSLPISSAVTTVFLVCQGVLAGMALLALVLTQRPDGDLAFLTQYGASAGDMRRAFYILTTASFVGTADKFLRDRGDGAAWARKPNGERFRAFLVPCLYLLSLALGFITFGADNRIVNFQNATRDLTPALSEDIVLWHGATWSRACVVTLAWLLSCIDLQGESQSGADAMNRREALQRELTITRARLARLEGAAMHEMGLTELEALRVEQKALLEATDRAMEVRLLRKSGRAGRESGDEDDNGSVLSRASHQSSVAPPPAPGGRRARRTEERIDE